jgi:hypothetical protein
VHASKVQASSSPSGRARARPALHPPSPSSPVIAFTPLPHSLDPSFLAATTGWAPPPVFQVGQVCLCPLVAFPFLPREIQHPELWFMPSVFRSEHDFSPSSFDIWQNK